MQRELRCVILIKDKDNSVTYLLRAGGFYAENVSKETAAGGDFTFEISRKNNAL